jgi:hypothetical protein
MSSRTIQRVCRNVANLKPGRSTSDDSFHGVGQPLAVGIASLLKAWGMLHRQRGLRKGEVAVARKLTVMLHQSTFPAAAVLAKFIEYRLRRVAKAPASEPAPTGARADELAEPNCALDHPIIVGGQPRFDFGHAAHAQDRRAG